MEPCTYGGYDFEVTDSSLRECRTPEPKMVSSTAAVVAVLLLSLLGLGQADTNPGNSALCDIQGI